MRFITDRKAAGWLALGLAVVVAIGLATHTILTKWTEPAKDAAVSKLHEDIAALGAKLEEPEPFPEISPGTSAAFESDVLSPGELRKHWRELLETLANRIEEEFGVNAHIETAHTELESLPFEDFMVESFMSRGDPKWDHTWKFLADNRDLADAMCKLSEQPAPPLALECGMELLAQPHKPGEAGKLYELMFSFFYARKFLVAEALVDVRDGKVDDALRRLTAACRMDEAAANAPAAYQIVLWASYEPNPFAFLADSNRISNDDIRPLLDALMASQKETFARRGAAWQAINVALFQRGLPDCRAFSDYSTYQIAWRLYSTFGGPLVNNDTERGMTLLSDFNTLAESAPVHEIVARREEYEKELEQLPVHSEFTRLSLRYMRMTMNSMGWTRAVADTTALGILVERQYHATGKYPESLDFAFDTLGVNTLLDPFTGQPYRYVRFDDGHRFDFAVYSVGEDKEDDLDVEKDLGWFSVRDTAER